MDVFARGKRVFDVIDRPATTDRTDHSAVLLHGFPQTAASWDAVSATLNAAGIRTLAPNQRGYAPGARPRGRYAYRMPELVADVATLIDVAGDGPVHLIGHDWGAAVAWSLAANRPDLVRTLTTVSVPHPGAFLKSMVRSDQARKSWYMAAFQPPLLPELLAYRRPALFDHFLRGTGMTDELITQVHRDIVDTGALTGALNWYRAMPFTRPGALTAPISVPTAHVWGAQDSALGRTGAELAAEYVSADYHFHIFENADHRIPDKQPNALAKVILDRINPDAIGY